ncbi:hypothetical protein D3C78_1605630 [compost metagenome]
MLARFAIGEQLLQLLGHALTSTLAFAADTRDGRLQIGQHLVHPRLHAVLSGLHIGQQLRDHLGAVLR